MPAINIKHNGVITYHVLLSVLGYAAKHIKKIMLRILQADNTNLDIEGQDQ